MTAAAARPSDLRAFFGALAFPLTAAVVLGVSVVTFGLRGPGVALTVNVYVLFEVAGFSQVLRLPRPAWYLRTWRVERTWIYEWLGIRAFKHLMRSETYRRFNPNLRLSGARSGLLELRQTMVDAEIAHAVAFILVMVLSGASAFAGWFDTAGWLMFFNVLFNGYPVMLQRFNRLRLDRLLR